MKTSVAIAFVLFVQGIWVPWFNIIDTSCSKIRVINNLTYCADMFPVGFSYFMASILTALAILGLGAWDAQMKKDKEREERMKNRGF